MYRSMSPSLSPSYMSPYMSWPRSHGGGHWKTVLIVVVILVALAAAVTGTVIGVRKHKAKRAMMTAIKAQAQMVTAAPIALAPAAMQVMPTMSALM